MDFDDPNYIIPLELIDQRWHLTLTDEETTNINSVSSLAPKNIDAIEDKMDSTLALVRDIITSTVNNNNRIELIESLEKWVNEKQSQPEVELIKPSTAIKAKGMF
jgi:hypothetical protein